MRPGTTCAAILAAPLLLVGCELGAPAATDAPADPEAGEVEVRLAGPGGAALVVAVHLNGTGPHDFVLDTGATYTCVDEGLAAELDLPEATGVEGIGVGVGGAGAISFARVDSLRVGAAAASDLPVCLLDLAGIGQMADGASGLLGLNFLREFHLWLDVEGGLLRLSDPAATP